MSQRIHLNPNRGQPMQQSYQPSYQPDPISTRRPGTRSDNEYIAKIQEVSSTIEDMIEIYSQVSRGLPQARGGGKASAGGAGKADNNARPVLEESSRNNGCPLFGDAACSRLASHSPPAHLALGPKAELRVANPSPSAHGCPRSRASLSSRRLLRTRSAFSPSGVTRSGTSRSTGAFPGA